jgi:hypothetical protein
VEPFATGSGPLPSPRLIVRDQTTSPALFVEWRAPGIAFPIEFSVAGITAELREVSRHPSQFDIHFVGMASELKGLQHLVHVRAAAEGNENARVVWVRRKSDQHDFFFQIVLPREVGRANNVWPMAWSPQVRNVS